MKKTFITQLPDQSGAFLAASRIIAKAGGNITRVSYNKAVDTHTLFLDVFGTDEQLQAISGQLQSIGYIQNQRNPPQVMLLEFRLQDVPGAVLPVLELIHQYHFNISYISSKENETDYQLFKMGLFVDAPDEIKLFLDDAAKICPIRVIHYDESERVLDNTVFYIGFANKMAEKLSLTKDEALELMTQSNLIMQFLDDRNEPFYKTFDYISRFAEHLSFYQGSRFEAAVSRHRLKDGLVLHVIEPPCGSNTYILEKDERLLFIDSGFACYKQEMLGIFQALFPDFENMRQEIIITHPDIDHCGLLTLFGTVHVSPLARDYFLLETRNEPNFREQNPFHAPYSRISRILSKYATPMPETLHVIEPGVEGEPPSALPYIGSLPFSGLKLDVYQGNGGHAAGEVIIVEETNRLVFSGDIMVNIQGFSRPQAAFNRLAPYLMTSVNMDSRQAAIQRVALLEAFPLDRFIYCCGHGAIMFPNERMLD